MSYCPSCGESRPECQASRAAREGGRATFVCDGGADGVQLVVEIPADGRVLIQLRRAVEEAAKALGGGD